MKTARRCAVLLLLVWVGTASASAQRPPKLWVGNAVLEQAQVSGSIDPRAHAAVRGAVLIEGALGTVGAAAGAIIGSAASSRDYPIFPAMGAGAFGGTVLGSYAAHRRPSVLGSALGAGVPALVGTVVGLGIAQDEEPTRFELVAMWSCGVLTVLGAVAGAHVYL